MQRVFWLDAARAISILLVVFTHVKEQIGIDNYLLRGLSYDIDRLGVPVFFMLSGGLILPKLLNINITAFYKKRIPQFFILLVLCSILTNLTKNYLFSSVHDFQTLFSILKNTLKNDNAIFPAKTGGAGQLWFMYTIIQLYIIAPFLARFVEKLTNREIILFIILCVFFGQFKQSVGTKVDISFLNRIGSDFLGSFLVYYLLGYLFLHRNIKLKYVTSFLLLVLPVFVIFLREWHRKDMIGTFHWYSSSIFIVLSSIGFINLIRHYFENKEVKQWVVILSRYSFGIYLWHYLFIYIAKWAVVKYFDKPMLYINYFIFSLFCSFMITHFFAKSKYTKWLVI